MEAPTFLFHDCWSITGACAVDDGEAMECTSDRQCTGQLTIFHLHTVNEPLFPLEARDHTPRLFFCRNTLEIRCLSIVSSCFFRYFLGKHTGSAGLSVSTYQVLFRTLKEQYQEFLVLSVISQFLFCRYGITSAIDTRFAACIYQTYSASSKDS